MNIHVMDYLYISHTLIIHYDINQRTATIKICGKSVRFVNSSLCLVIIVINANQVANYLGISSFLLSV